MMKRRYTYTVLRYVHDIVTGEFVNVGVVAYFPRNDSYPAILKSATRHTIGRMRELFPDLDRSDFLAAMRAVDRCAKKLELQIARDGLGLSEFTDASSLARQLIVSDDSALQWSTVGGGLCESVDRTFDQLYDRFVARYDDKSKSRRSDDEIWKPVRQRLIERDLDVPLEEKKIEGEGDFINFQHAWKNGVWHVYEPISLDLADADGIYKKAHRWLGQMASVVPNSTEPFHAHFIVGAPENLALLGAYENAIRILQKSPGKVEIYKETEIESLVNKIETDVRAHSVQ